jgi:hypothetical protein
VQTSDRSCSIWAERCLEVVGLWGSCKCRHAWRSMKLLFVFVQTQVSPQGGFNLWAHSLYRGLKKTELFWQSALFPQMFLWQTLNTAMIHSQNSVSTQWASQLLAWRLSSLPHVLGAGEGQRWLLFLSPLLDLSSNPACTYFLWKFTPNLGRERLTRLGYNTK